MVIELFCPLTVVTVNILVVILCYGFCKMLLLGESGQKISRVSLVFIQVHVNLQFPQNKKFNFFPKSLKKEKLEDSHFPVSKLITKLQ